MEQIIAAHTITETDGKNETFAIPDLIKLMGSSVKPGYEIFIPVSYRAEKVSFWESGGRTERHVLSIGNVITGPNDKLLDALLFNKIKRTPNGKHALVNLRPGHCMYVGKIRIRENSVAPKIKIIKLQYAGLEESMNSGKIYFGKFIVVSHYTSYGEVQGCVPAERLINKLYTNNVTKPYFANGWSISNTVNTEGEDRIRLRDNCNRIAQVPLNVEHHALADVMLDTLEDSIVRLENKNLSAALQIIDFDKELIEFRPLKNLQLSDVINTIDNAEPTGGYSVSFDSAKECYNQAILFNSPDIPSIELGMKYDNKFALHLGDRRYAVLRGWRG